MRSKSAFLAAMAVLLLSHSYLLLSDESVPSREGQVLPSVPEPSLDPSTRAALETAIRNKDYASAEKQLAELIEQNPKSHQLLTLLGRVLFMDNQPLNAAIAFSKAEKIQALKEEDLFTRAMSFVVLNRRDWARRELEKLAIANGSNARYIYWLARLDYDDMLYAAGIEKLKKALELDPEFMKAYDNLGLCYEGLGNYDEASRSYEKANELNRKQNLRSAWPSLNYGSLLLKRGRYEEAERYLREALGYDPKVAQVHFQIGTLLEKQEKYKEAIEELNAAAALDPTYPEPYYSLTRVYRSTGDLKSAESAARTFQRLKQEKQKDNKLDTPPVY